VSTTSTRVLPSSPSRKATRHNFFSFYQLALHCWVSCCLCLECFLGVHSCFHCPCYYQPCLYPAQPHCLLPLRQLHAPVLDRSTAQQHTLLFNCLQIGLVQQINKCRHDDMARTATYDTGQPPATKRSSKRKLLENPPLPETPVKVRHDVDEHLDYLNTRWKLGLPRLRGRAAVESESTTTLAQRCSSRLRYL
jgi:hypothetical protein